jgi:hypothetical protein
MATYFARPYGKVYGTGATSAGLTSVGRVYTFNTPELSWTVTHNLGTYNFVASLFNSANQQFFAGVKVISPNQFIVYMTEPTAGSVNVVFSL